MAQKVSKLSRDWISQCRKEFREFLEETGFPDPERNGTRGSPFEYPEWLIMFIGVLAVKAKGKNYLAIHRLVCEYWDVIGRDIKRKVISERQLRDRLKKISFKPGVTPGYVSQIFCDTIRY
jgi:hypothetical protein